MQLLVIAILALCTGLLLFILSNLTKENKELQSLVNASRANLKNAEIKVQQRDKFIKTQRGITTEQEKFIKEFCEHATSNDYNNKEAKLDKLIELARDYQSKN